MTEHSFDIVDIMQRVPIGRFSGNGLMGFLPIGCTIAIFPEP
jgi:hypothetical protein